ARRGRGSGENVAVIVRAKIHGREQLEGTDRNWHRIEVRARAISHGLAADGIELFGGRLTHGQRGIEILLVDVEQTDVRLGQRCREHSGSNYDGCDQYLLHGGFSLNFWISLRGALAG